MVRAALSFGGWSLFVLVSFAPWLGLGCSDAVGEDSCGNLVVDDGEQCDDGNTIDNDGCSAECLSESFCGNSLVESGEECDDGNVRGGDGCSSICHLEGDCGNGIIDNGEICDGSSVGEQTCNAQTGLTNGALACATDCRSYDTSGCHECGNDFIEGPEACDGSNLRDETCMSQTGLPSGTLLCEPDCLGFRTTLCSDCGNGESEGLEACDDGNAVAWDGCTDCTITEFQVNTHTMGFQQSPDVAIVEDGSFIVVWQSGFGATPGKDGDGFGVFGQRFDSDGHPLSEEFMVNTFTEDDQWQPAVAAAADGAFVVVWTSGSLLNNEANVFGQRFDPAGVPLGVEFSVNSFNSGAQMDPAIAMAPDGNFVVVWASHLQDGSGSGVFGQRYDPTGNPLGVEFQVNTYTAQSQWIPDVAMAADGRFVVIWTSEFQDGSEHGIFGQRFGSTGNPTGVEFQVNTNTADDQTLPSVAMATDGRTVVVWSGYGQDGSDAGVFAQRCDGSGNLIGLGPWP